MIPPLGLPPRFVFAVGERVSVHGIVGEVVTHDGPWTAQAGTRREDHGRSDPSGQGPTKVRLCCVVHSTRSRIRNAWSLVIC